MLDYIKQYTNEYFNEVLQNARKTCPDYETALQQRIARSREANTILSDGEEASQFKAYIASIYHAAGLESELLYRQGYSDCMEVLRFLGVM